MSTQEFTTATAKIPGKKVPIIIVPGIMGSRLTDPANGSLIWNPTGIKPSEPGSFAADFDRLFRVTDPLVPDETHKFIHVADRVHVDPVNHFYTTIAGFYGDLALSLHYDLRKTLAPKGLVPAVYCCGYDWRQDNAASAARLSTMVEEARADCNNEQVILVAHSMGGLVSRFYCKQLGGESKVRAVFLLGSPTLGAVKAYREMREGLAFTDAVRRVLNASADQTRLFMRRMQSVYQLLPNFIYCSKVRTRWATFDGAQTGHLDTALPNTPLQVPAMMFNDNSNSALFYLDLYPGLTDDVRTRDQVRQNIGRCLQFEVELTVGGNIYMHPRTFTFFCNTLPTPGNMSIAFNGVTVSSNNVVNIVSTLSDGPTVVGDATVPADSANPVPVSAPFVEVRPFSGIDHVALSSDPNVIATVRDRIASVV